MGKKLFVGNLPWSVREDDLRRWLESLGYSCERAEVIVERDTGRSRGFGFLHFATEAAAAEILRELDNAEIGGRQIHLEEASSERRGSSRGRRDQGQWTRSDEDEEDFS